MELLFFISSCLILRKNVIVNKFRIRSYRCQSPALTDRHCCKKQSYFIEQISCKRTWSNLYEQCVYIRTLEQLALHCEYDANYITFVANLIIAIIAIQNGQNESEILWEFEEFQLKFCFKRTT